MHVAACITASDSVLCTFDGTAVPGVTPFASAVKFQKRSGTGAHGLYVVVFADSTEAVVVVVVEV
jgi:hypothetical protein